MGTEDTGGDVGTNDGEILGSRMTGLRIHSLHTEHRASKAIGL